MDTLKARVAELLEAARVTHQTAASICKLSVQTVHFLSSGRRTKIKAPTLVKLAQGFGVSSDWLLGISSQRPSNDVLRARVVGLGFELKQAPGLADATDPAAPDGPVVVRDGFDQTAPRGAA